MPNKHLAADDPLQAKLEPLRSIPSMIGDMQRIALYEIGRQHTGRGCVVEVGSWLGSSCAHLGQGLADAQSSAEVHCFDRFCADAAEVQKAAAMQLPLREGQDTSAIFQANVRSIYPHITAHRTEISQLRWTGEPIEIYVDDASKRPSLFRNSLRQLGPALIPGVSIVALLDFWHFLRLPPGTSRRRAGEYQMLAMERLSKHFTMYRNHDRRDSGAYFRYETPIRFKKIHKQFPPHFSLGHFPTLRKIRQSARQSLGRAA
jgi:hypothetical protein